MQLKFKPMLIAIALTLAGTASGLHAAPGDVPLGDPRLGQSDEAAARAASSTEAFESMDRNKDGVITPTEAVGPIAVAFNDLDASRDGKIDYAEFVQLEKAYRPPNDGPRP